MEVSAPTANIYVCRPHTPVGRAWLSRRTTQHHSATAGNLLVEYDILKPLAWLYTPMALPLVPALEPQALIYDCMDELSAFFNAPRQLLQRGRCPVQVADLVFTGGASLYQAKKGSHHNVHCFPAASKDAFRNGSRPKHRPS